MRQQTLANCFRKCDFTLCASDDATMGTTDSDEVPKCPYWAQVVDSVYAPTFKDYAAVDATRAVAGELTEEDIISTAKICDRCLVERMAMHACQIGPTDTAPPCPGSPHRACVVTRGEGAKICDGTKGDKKKENITEEEGPLPDPVTSRKVMTAIDTLTYYLETIETG